MDAVGKTIHLRLTKEQVRKSADIHSHQPVARRFQIDYFILDGHSHLAR
jgi:hypothetical protein